MSTSWMFGPVNRTRLKFSLETVSRSMFVTYPFIFTSAERTASVSSKRQCKVDQECAGVGPAPMARTGVRMDAEVTRDGDGGASGRTRPKRSEKSSTSAPGSSHWKFLAEASEHLDSSLDYQETLKNVISLAVPAIADYAAVALTDADGSMRWGWSSHRDPTKSGLAAQLSERSEEHTSE